MDNNEVGGYKTRKGRILASACLGKWEVARADAILCARAK